MSDPPRPDNTALSRRSLTHHMAAQNSALFNFAQMERNRTGPQTGKGGMQPLRDAEDHDEQRSWSRLNQVPDAGGASGNSGS